MTVDVTQLLYSRNENTVSPYLCVTANTVILYFGNAIFKFRNFKLDIATVDSSMVQCRDGTGQDFLDPTDKTQNLPRLTAGRPAC